MTLLPFKQNLKIARKQFSSVRNDLHQRIEWKFKGNSVAGAADAAVSTVPAFEFVLLDHARRFAALIVDFKNIGRAIPNAFATTDTLFVIKNRWHSFHPFQICG